MNTIEISFVVLACTFGGSLCGMTLKAVLPKHLLSDETKDLVKLGMGLIATMTAIVLGLLISSAKDSFDSKTKELTDMSVNLMLLDRTLAHYGAETRPTRGLLRDAAVRILDQTWSRGSTRSPQLDPAAAGAEVIYDRLQALLPKTEEERSLRSQSLAIGLAISRARYLLFEQSSNSVATPLLVILVAWLTVLFISFGLMSPFNATTIATLLVCSAAVSSAIWLILEMYQPFQGVLQVSDAPLRTALSHLGL